MKEKTSEIQSPVAALRWAILENTVGETGERYLVGLAQGMETCGAWVTKYLEERRQLRAQEP